MANVHREAVRGGAQPRGNAHLDNLTGRGMFRLPKLWQSGGRSPLQAPFDSNAILSSVQPVDREEKS